GGGFGPGNQRALRSAAAGTPHRYRLPFVARRARRGGIEITQWRRGAPETQKAAIHVRTLCTLHGDKIDAPGSTVEASREATGQLAVRSVGPRHSGQRPGGAGAKAGAAAGARGTLLRLSHRV